MIVSQESRINEILASSIIGGVEEPVALISTTNPTEAESIITSEKNDIDLFAFQVKMYPRSGTVLESLVRKIKRYEDKPVLLLTNLSYNMVGYPMLAGYESYKYKNYISMPLDRIDAQAKLCLYLDEILKDHRRKRSNLIYLEHSQGELVIDRKEILYAEVQNKILTVHCDSGEFKLKRMTLQDFCLLVGNESFVQCHKSFALNLEALNSIERNGRRNWLAVFSDTNECPISQTYYDNVRKKYVHFMTK